MKYRGIATEEDTEKTQAASNVKGAFYRDVVSRVVVDESTLPEREQIASATNRMKASLFKQNESVGEEQTEKPTVPSAALAERIRIAQKFTKKSGGMKDL